MSDRMEPASVRCCAELEARMRLLRLERERGARLALYAEAWEEAWARPSKGGVIHSVTPFRRVA